LPPLGDDVVMLQFVIEMLNRNRRSGD